VLFGTGGLTSHGAQARYPEAGPDPRRHPAACAVARCMMLLGVKRRRRLGWLLTGVLGLGLVWAAVVVPPLIIDTHQIQDPAKRLDEINGLRTTLAGVLGGLAVIGGAVVGYLNFRETSRQNRALLDLQSRGQVTERFTRAIEQLGQADKLDVRIGAVYALEQIARDSAELHWPIMEVLTAYLREHAPVRSEPAEPPVNPQEIRTPADLQTIATVIGRRKRSQDPNDQRLDLGRVDLRGVYWPHAQLDGANLMVAQLDGANLIEAKLEKALLIGTELREAKLSRGQLNGANLTLAQLQRAFLRGAQLKEAYLGGADLQRAELQFAQLRGANLAEARLEGADLQDADLTQVEGLTWDQLQATYNVDLAKLPSYLLADRPVQAKTPEPG
jgi:uncharacterized protein YjbI with pentapeptide repeats